MKQVEETPSPPLWLNQAFVENALREGFNNHRIKVLRLEVEAATAVGDHYGSQMFRFKLTVEGEREEKLSVLVKILPEGVLADKMEVLNVFQREGEAFLKILPRVQGILEKAYPGHETLWARCYYGQGSPRQAIVLEDLKEKGFVLGNRLGLDVDHTELVLRTLVKFHASSLLLEEESVEKAPFFWSRQNSETVKSILKIPFLGMLKAFKNWSEFKGKDILLEKLKNLEVVFLERVFKCWERDESKLNVLLHGDSWVNNFMFRYDDNRRVNGIKLVDFQLINRSRPSMDLQYFLFTSVSPDLVFDRFDDFLRSYHETFEDTLKRLGHTLRKPFGLNDLRKDFGEDYVWGLVVFCSISPLVVQENSEFTPDDYFRTQDGSNFEEMYSKEDVRERLKRGLAFFQEKGVF